MSGFCSESDWLRKRHEVSGPITEHRKAKPKQSRISTDTLLKKKFIRKNICLLKSLLYFHAHSELKCLNSTMLT